MDGKQAQEQNFGIPDRIWDQYFGPQGEISKIKNEELPAITGKLNDICRKIDRVESKLDKLPDHAPRILTLEKRMGDQELKCIEELVNRNTAQATRREVVKEIHEAEEVIRQQEWKKFQRIIMLIGAVCTIIGAGIALLGMFVF